MRLIISFTLLLCLTGCGGTQQLLSRGGLLSEAGLTALPDASEYEDYGAVILLDNSSSEFYIHDRKFYRREEHHFALIYFSEKAEAYLTQYIYLNDDSKLISFKGRTLLPDGRSIEIDDSELFPVQLKPEFVEFSTNSSRNFTFPGVEPGAILEYSVVVEHSDLITSFARWDVN